MHIYIHDLELPDGIATDIKVKVSFFPMYFIQINPCLDVTLLANMLLIQNKSFLGDIFWIFT